MAEQQPQRTDDLDLGPGLVVTPGYEIAPKPQAGVTMSDRPLDRHGNTIDLAVQLGTAQPEQPAPPVKPAK